MDINKAKDKIQAEAFKALKKSGFDGIVMLPTGVGKGKIMIDSIHEIKPKTIGYFCNTELARDVTFKDELKKWDAAHLEPYIEFVCYQTACKWKGKKFDLGLFDEFDSALTPEYIKAITNNVFDKRIFVSATLEEAKKRKALKIAPIVYERNVIEMIEEKVLNKQKFYFVNYDLTPEENKRYLQFNKEFSYYLNQPKSKFNNFKLEQLKIFRKQFLNGLGSSVKVAKWVLNKLDKPENKVMVFTGLSKQADKICPPYSFHSKNDIEGLKYFQQFCAGIINKIVIVNKVDRALNIVGVNNIIFESVDSSKTKLTQRTGRGMRLHVDDTLNIFFLIPYYRDYKGMKKPTIVQNWILKSTVEMDISKAINIDYQ